MYVRLVVFAWVLFASACTTAVGGDDEVVPDTQASLPARIVTANDLVATGEALWVDLSRPGAAVRLEGWKSVRDLARVHVLAGSSPPTTADEMVRVAGVAFGRELPLDHLLLRANLDRLTKHLPNPECAGALPVPTGCCACGLIGHPCLGLVCIEPRSK